MRHLIRLLVIAASALALMGCVQTDIAVKLNPDGSGTLQETVMMSKAVTAQMRETMKSLQPEEEAGKPVELWSEEDVSAQAGGMGEGVKFESMELVEDGDFEGYRAVFSFTDINKLLVNENPGSNVPQQGEEGEEGGGAKKGEFIRFSFDKGAPSTLTIRQPEAKAKPAEKPAEKGEGEKPKEDPAQKEMMMAMMKMMLEGMKLAVSVEVPGEVVSTNATYRDGSRIILMDMDFDKLLASEEDWKKFAEQNPNSVEGTKDIMRNIPGMKVEQEKEITIKFN